MHKKCLKKKILLMAGTLLANSKELGISDEDFQKIKDLKVRTKKSYIKSRAETETVLVDIISALWDRSMDIAKVNELIDKKYELKRQGMKELAGAWFELKSMLSQEQMEKTWKFYKEERAGGSERKECCEYC
ncbi:MAG: hypothetical protein AB1650_00235 [Candidatus Omnitrophota bacterium]